MEYQAKNEDIKLILKLLSVHEILTIQELLYYANGKLRGIQIFIDMANLVKEGKVQIKRTENAEVAYVIRKKIK